MYELAQTTAKPVAPVATMDAPLATTSTALVPAAPLLPAPLPVAAAPNALRYEQRFGDLIALRGKDPKPTKFVHRFFNGTPAWGVVGGAVAAALTLPLVALGLEAAVPMFFIGTGACTFIPAFIGGLAYNEFATPFSLLTSGKHLKEKDLAFLDGLENASPTERAVIGLLARRWMARIDSQFVHGEAAFARIEDLANAGEQMPSDARETARKIVALQDAMVDSHGRPQTKFASYEIRKLVQAFKDLPPVEQRACAPHLIKLYFKGEVVRVKVEKHEDARALYRALRDGSKTE